MLNTYLREFVQNSINDWVEFVRSFTVPNYAEGELWKRSTAPFIIINLEKVKSEKKGSKKGMTIEYKPSIRECS
jgi:hypothetical protein